MGSPHPAPPELVRAFIWLLVILAGLAVAVIAILAYVLS